MDIPSPTPPSQHRNLIAQLQRDNRDCNRKVSILLQMIEGLSHSINDAIETIAMHEHNDSALMVLEADLAESINVTNEQLIEL